jgi:peptidoglycan/LPS O-acetylase OafA/YrhL
MDYRREIDGLRAVAVIPVILYHAGFGTFAGGYVGVDVFFVISGYLITSIIVSDQRAGKFTLVNFYGRRARRLLPALFLVIFCTLPFAWFWMLPQDLKAFSDSVIAVSVFASNIYFYASTGYFETAAELKPLLHTWSLAVEEQYYLLFPVFLMLTWRLGTRWVVALLSIAAAVSLGAAQWGSTTNPSFAFFMLPTRGWEILLGALIALYLLPQRGAARSANRSVRQSISVVGLLLILYAVFAFDRETPYPSFYTLLPTVGTGLIILFAAGDTIVGSILGSWILVGIGLISYSAYLWHQPLFAFARLRTLDEPGHVLLIALALASFGLAYFSWKYVEMPFRRAHVITRKQVFAFGATCSLILITLGAIGSLGKGFKNRFDAAVIAQLEPPSGTLSTCNEHFAKTAGATCVLGDSAVAPTMALIGDSHAMRLTKRLSEMLAERHQSAIAYAEGGCIPFLDIGERTHNLGNDNCRDYVRSSYADIINNRSIERVVLFSEWSLYTEGVRYGSRHISYFSDAETRATGVQENLAVFERGLQRTKIALENAGKKIIVVKSVPEYDASVPATLAKAMLLDSRIPPARLMTHEKFALRNKLAEDAFSAANLGSWADVVEPVRLFCDQRYCSYADARSNSLYEDDNHLSYLGSWIVVDEILRKIGY